MALARSAYAVRQPRERTAKVFCDECANARGIDVVYLHDAYTGAEVRELHRDQKVGKRCTQCHRGFA